MNNIKTYVVFLSAMVSQSHTASTALPRRSIARGLTTGRVFSHAHSAVGRRLPVRTERSFHRENNNGHGSFHHHSYPYWLPSIAGVYLLATQPSFCDEDVMQQQEQNPHKLLWDYIAQDQDGENMATFRQLCQTVADLSTLDEHKRLPLYEAAKRGKLAVVKVLLEAGARATQVQPFTEEEFDTVMFNSPTIAIAIEVMGKGSISQCDKPFSHIPLHAAAEGGHADVVAALLSAGENVNRQDMFGNTALHFAADNGHPTVVQLLLTKGAHPNVSNLFLQKPLNIAASQGNVAIVSALLAAGANGEIFEGVSDGQGNFFHPFAASHKTPLQAATDGGHTKVISLLQDI